MGSTPLRATAAEDALRGGAARRRLDRRRGRAGRRGHRPARRPERDARLQAPPGARAARAGRSRTAVERREPRQPRSTSSEALAGERYLADQGLVHCRLPRRHAGAAAAARGRGGRRQDRGRQGAGGRDRRAADPAAVPRGHRPAPRRLRLGLPAPAAAPRAPRRRRRARATRSASSCCGARCSRRSSATEPGGAADRRDRPRRRRVRGVPARVPVRLPGHDPRARARSPPSAARSWCSPRTARASCTTRSSAAASTTGSTTRRPSARPRSSARGCPACRTRSPSGSARAVARLRGEELYKLPGVGETIAWAQALLALDDADLDETLGVVLKVREDIERRASAGCCTVPERDARADPAARLASRRRLGLRSPAGSRSSRPRCARPARASGMGELLGGPSRARCGRSRRSRRRLLRAARHAVLAPRRPRRLRRRLRRVVRPPRAASAEPPRDLDEVGARWRCRASRCPAQAAGCRVDDRRGRRARRLVRRGAAAREGLRRLHGRRAARWRGALMRRIAARGADPAQPPHATGAPARRRAARRAPDLRATMRASLRTGGDPLERHWREPGRAAAAARAGLRRVRLDGALRAHAAPVHAGLRRGAPARARRSCSARA